MTSEVARVDCIWAGISTYVLTNTTNYWGGRSGVVRGTQRGTHNLYLLVIQIQSILILILLLLIILHIHLPGHYECLTHLQNTREENISMIRTNHIGKEFLMDSRTCSSYT